MSSPLGKIGDWAAEAEREEEEEKNRLAAAAALPSSFPNLKDSVKQQQQQTKKKKKTMTLSEFNAPGGVGGKDSGLTPVEMRLPTRPKERSEDEIGTYGRLGGFSGYGGGGGTRDLDGRRLYGRGGGGFDEDRRGGEMMQPRVSSEFEPSRADVVNDWGSGKRVLPAADAGGRPGRYGDVVGSGAGRYRADETDNWGAGKKAFITPVSGRSTAFGSGFRGVSGTDSGRWERGGGSFLENNGQERTRLVLEPRKENNVSGVGATGNKPNPFGAARPREEVLAEKGLDWKKHDSDIEAKVFSRPTSSQSSRPNSAQSIRSENVSLQGVEAVVKPKPKVNPFGDAKPREVLLEEKGKDWRKIDMELERRVNRPETEEENLLKEEINRLKNKLEKEPHLRGTGPNASDIHDIINQKERELEQLAREFDDKIRFGQRGSDRPGSGAGGIVSFSDRPPSRSGSLDEPRGTGFVERPRSRGTADIWSKSDDSRSFQAGRERRYTGSRDMDRQV